MTELSDFSKQVIKFIQMIPAGKVATYGQIADLAGKKYAARGVAWILHSSSKTYKLPWHRVLNSQGKISFPKTTRNFSEQKKRLLLEGVDVDAKGRLDLLVYQWSKKPNKKKALTKNQPQIFS